MIAQRKILWPSWILALLTLILGCIVMVGWVTRSTSLLLALPIKFNAALLLAISGLGTVFHCLGWKKLALVLGLIILLVALSTLLEYILDLNVGIDQLFIKIPTTTDTQYPGRMAPNTSVGMSFIAVSMILLGMNSIKSNHWMASSFATLAIACGLVPLMGYLAGVEEAYGWGEFTQMSLPTAIGIVCLGLALFFATVTYDRFGKFSAWLIVPLALGAFMTTLLLVRAWEVNYFYVHQRQGNYFHNTFMVFFFAVMFVITIILLRVTVSMTNRLEVAKNMAELNNTAKTNILRYVNHEMRNPLTALLGFSEPFINDTTLRPDLKEAMCAIHTTALHMRDVISDLVQAAQLETGKIQLKNVEFNVDDWIKKIAQSLIPPAQKRKIDFSYLIHNTVPPILIADPSKLTQIVMNLVGNAFKFTPEGGRVSLRLWISDIRTGEKTLVIQVQDTGRGIPAGLHSELFTPFFQAHTSDKELGLGLGLTICKTLVEMMDGIISVTSIEGEGTTFTCEITLQGLNND